MDSHLVVSTMRRVPMTSVKIGCKEMNQSLQSKANAGTKVQYSFQSPELKNARHRLLLMATFRTCWGAEACCCEASCDGGGQVHLKNCIDNTQGYISRRHGSDPLDRVLK